MITLRSWPRATMAATMAAAKWGTTISLWPLSEDQLVATRSQSGARTPLVTRHGVDAALSGFHAGFVEKDIERITRVGHHLFVRCATRTSHFG